MQLVLSFQDQINDLVSDLQKLVQIVHIDCVVERTDSADGTRYYVFALEYLHDLPGLLNAVMVGWQPYYIRFEK